MRSLSLDFGICLAILLLQVSCKVTPKDQTDFYKKFIPGLDFEVETGYASVDSLEGDTTTHNYFYHLIYKQGTTSATLKSTDPLILWLNGGPGCASQFGLFGEIGPFVVSNDETTKELTVTLRPLSWNLQSAQLFVDQPFGAGFSWSDSTNLVNNTQQAAAYFTEFLIEFFTQHPKLKQNPFYLFGESFAGHYIPAIGVQIFENPQLSAMGINYQGVGIGDGWTAPFQQLAYYGSYLYTIGLVDNLRRDFTTDLSTQGQQNILNKNYQAAQTFFDEASGDILQNYTGNISPYNFQQYPKSGEEEDPFIKFLNSNKEQFQVPASIEYQDCNDAVYNAFQNDITTSRESDIVYLLGKGRVLLYNGQLDYIVNTPGALLWINQMKWDKISAWKQSTKQIFTVNDQTVGSVKSFDNLTFVIIYKAGHMVPSDQPEAASAMLQHYLKGDKDWK